MRVGGCSEKQKVVAGFVGEPDFCLVGAQVAAEDGQRGGVLLLEEEGVGVGGYDAVLRCEVELDRSTGAGDAVEEGLV